MRKSQAKKLPLAPDARYNDKLVTRFINNLMWEGKKSVAINIFYDAVDKVSKITGEDGYEMWKKALGNVTPSVEVRSRRIGGATFQIPTEVRQDRKISLSMKWLIRYSRDRNGKTMADKLANEIVAASKGEGAAFKKKEDTHRKARFKTVISLIWNNEEFLFEGVCNGHIIEEQKGNEGFGYDPVFIPDGADKTFAEMSMQEKNIYSHRRKATDQLIAFLQNQH